MTIPFDWDLSNRAALITSDMRGWTPYFAAALAEAGADVVVAGSGKSDRSEAVDAVRSVGNRAVELDVDLTDAKDVDGMIFAAISELGRLDILVNNARLEFGKSFIEVTDDEWDSVIAFNLKSMFLCCRAAGRSMLDQGYGRIVNMGSGLAERGLWNSAAMCASQGAVRQLTASLGLEWAKHNIRVNGIGAGWITTDPKEATDLEDLLVRYIPSRRRGHPNDLAGLLVYLASEGCDFVTGQTIYVDGGVMAHA